MDEDLVAAFEEDFDEEPDEIVDGKLKKEVRFKLPPEQHVPEKKSGRSDFPKEKSPAINVPPKKVLTKKERAEVIRQIVEGHIMDESEDEIDNAALYQQQRMKRGGSGVAANSKYSFGEQNYDKEDEKLSDGHDAFNMSNEREEGYWDEYGNWHWNEKTKEEKSMKDNWIDSLERGVIADAANKQSFFVTNPEAPEKIISKKQPVQKKLTKSLCVKKLLSFFNESVEDMTIQDIMGTFSNIFHETLLDSLKKSSSVLSKRKKKALSRQDKRKADSWKTYDSSSSEEENDGYLSYLATLSYEEFQNYVNHLAVSGVSEIYGMTKEDLMKIL